MSFSAIAASSFGGTGWLALALFAIETWSLLQPANKTAAAMAADPRSARTKLRCIKSKLHTHRAYSRPQHGEYALKPLLKILAVGPLARNLNRPGRPVT